MGLVVCMKPNPERTGVLFMYAGLSVRAEGSPVRPRAITAWLHEENTDGLVQRETLWLFRTGHLTTVDGKAYNLTNEGWAALDGHLITDDEAADHEERETGEYLPREPQRPAREEPADMLIIMGEWLINAEAERLAANALRNVRQRWRDRRT